jgi:hypothetical protein
MSDTIGECKVNWHNYIRHADTEVSFIVWVMKKSRFSEKQTQVIVWSKRHAYSQTSARLMKFIICATRGLWITVVKMAQCKGLMSVRNEQRAVVEILAAENDPSVGIRWWTQVVRRNYRAHVSVA